MNVMATNHRRVTDPRWIQKHIEIVRKTSGGEIRCVTCHGPAITRVKSRTRIRSSKAASLRSATAMAAKPAETLSIHVYAEIGQQRGLVAAIDAGERSGRPPDQPIARAGM